MLANEITHVLLIMRIVFMFLTPPKTALNVIVLNVMALNLMALNLMALNVTGP